MTGQPTFDHAGCRLHYRLDGPAGAPDAAREKLLRMAAPLSAPDVRQIATPRARW